jgi:ABC-type multidrug transport system fused ATPase/permease subunit
MDEIVVLEGGRIAERGSFLSLLAKKGLFAGMAAQQGISSH